MTHRGEARLALYKTVNLKMKAIIYILLMIFCLNSFCYSQTVNEERIHRVSEISPNFPGGDAARLKYFRENFRYPQSAIDKRIQGTVFVTFVVETDGSITNAEIFRIEKDSASDQVRNIHSYYRDIIENCPDCEAEALRFVKEMPNWNPGRTQGNRVRTQFLMPIKFSLNE